MNAFFAAGIFDSPWVIVAVVVVSMVANWLSKRRQEKQSEGGEPAPSSPKSNGDFDLEETLRRLMGEEPPAPAPPPPPPIPRHSPRQIKPSVLLPPLPVAQSRPVRMQVSEQQREAARRFEQLNERGRHPATVVTHGRRPPPTGGRRVASPWRSPRKARQAFVASLVFAPPKGLEP